MTRKKLLGILFALFVVLAATYSWLSTRFLVLTSSRTARVEVNGAPVSAEVLEGTLTALVTTHESNGQRSYLLRFEGDTDSTGDTGSVVECHDWAAPRLPLLLVSTNHPPCIAGSKATTSRWSLIRKGRSLEFVTDDHRAVRITGLGK
jgi:hypothetical protein